MKSLLLRAAIIQLAAIATSGALAWYLGWTMGAWLLVTAILAVWFSYQSELPRWWLPIQMLFLPAMALVFNLGLPPWIFLLLFTLLLAVYGGVFSSRVPLYLTGIRTCEALQEIMPAEKNFYFLDLGCGTGRVLRFLDKRFSFGMFYGVETAPLPFVLAWLRSKVGRAQFRVMYQDMWKTDLSRYDVVYVFLSPQPMSELWQKVQCEMKPGSLFISNSFEVPGVTADKVITLDDGRATALHVWHIAKTQEAE